MRFSDAVTFYPAKTDTFNQVPVIDRDKAHEMMAVIEENAGLNRQGFYDQLTGDAHLYLPGNDDYLASTHYDITGYFAKFESRLYRVESTSVGRVPLTDNRVKLIECSLSKVDKEVS